MTEITSFRTEGLGNSTHLLVHDGRALLVDPQRDFERFLPGLGGADLRWVLETHIHNDYVSGGLAAATATGAELVLPAGAAPAFRSTPAFHREDLTDGNLTVRPLHTPGHTPEHTSYVVLVDGEELAVFTGGSLLVGSAGRSDLLGPDRAETLARLQYVSVNRLARLSDDTGLYPTHGAGSFCTVSAAGIHTSTIGQERRTNPVLHHSDVEAFLASHMSGLQPYPDYYSRMAPINLAGPPAMPEATPPTIDTADIDPTATVVDLRPAERFAASHLPGSVNIPLSDQFGTWFGWLVDPASEPILVVDSHQDLGEPLTQLARIGFDSVAGIVVDPGEAATATSRVATVDEVPGDAQILDVRSPGERAENAPAGSIHRYLPDLIEAAPAELESGRPVWVMCGGGYRATIGASLLSQQGFDTVGVIKGGIPDL